MAVRVLIAEFDASRSLDLFRALTQAGYEAIRVDDRHAAEHELASGNWSLAFVALALDDPPEVLKLTRQWALAGIPVVLVSSMFRSKPDWVEKARSAGACEICDSTSDSKLIVEIAGRYASATRTSTG